MSVSLSIKNVPEALAEALRQRAEANHRSLQRELMAIVEAAALGVDGPARRDIARPGVQEREGRHAVASPSGGAADDLLSELDAIVAGSRWGTAPLLAREQVNDRALTRTLDLDARADELAQARRRARRGAPT